jgi:hypothetical protein
MPAKMALFAPQSKRGDRNGSFRRSNNGRERETSGKK